MNLDARHLTTELSLPASLAENIREKGAAALLGEQHSWLQKRFLNTIPSSWLDHMAGELGLRLNTQSAYRTLSDCWMAVRASDADCQAHILPALRSAHADLFSTYNDDELLALWRSCYKPITDHIRQSQAPKPRFRKAHGAAPTTGLSPATMKEVLTAHFGSPAINALINAGKLHLLSDQHDLPIDIRLSSAGDTDSIAGATLSNGTVYLIGNRTTADTLAGLFLHEVGEHAGLADMLGPDYGRLTKQFQKLLRQKDTYATWAAMRVPASTRPENVASEQLAYLVERVANEETIREGGERGYALGQECLSNLRTWIFRTPLCRWMDEIGALDDFTLTPQDLAGLAREAVDFFVEQTQPGTVTENRNTWVNSLSPAMLDTLYRASPHDRIRELESLASEQALGYLYSLAMTKAPFIDVAIDHFAATLATAAANPDRPELQLIAGELLALQQRMDVQAQLRGQIDRLGFAMWMDGTSDPAKARLHFLTPSPAQHGMWQLNHYRRGIGAYADEQFQNVDDALALAGQGSFMVSDVEAPALLQDWAQPEVTDEPTNSQSFRRWFGSSQAIDSAGNPIILYRSAGSDLDGSATRASTSPELATQYGEYRGEPGKPNVTPVYMRVERPFNADRLEKTITLKSFFAEAISQSEAAGRTVQGEQAALLMNHITGCSRREQSGPYYQPQDVLFDTRYMFGRDGTDSIKAFLQLLGFDSIKMTEQQDQTFVVLDPAQVQPASGHKVTLDPGSTPEAAPDTAPADPVEALRRWAGNSKVVGEDGLPTVVFHATGADFTRFDSAMMGTGADHARSPTDAFWFSSSTTVSDSFARLLDTASVMPAFIKLENPLIVDCEKWARRFDTLDEGFKFGEGRIAYNIRWFKNEAIAEARAAGHDGVIFTKGYDGTPVEGAINYAVFEGSQIKSAIGNQGTYDPTTDDIRLHSSGDSQTELQAFKDWFSDSKVVSEDGKPLVVYHGTEADFSVFNIGDVGYHFGSQAAANKRLSDTRHERGNARTTRQSGPEHIMPVYLSINNPLRMPDAGDWDNPDAVASRLADLLAEDDALAEAYEKAQAQGGSFRDILERMGYDGIVYENVAEGGGDSWIAFRPEQIKSAIGNVGTFDPNSPDIRLKSASPVENEAFKNWFGNSKIVGEDGKPLVLYHGTKANFDTFKLGLSSRRDSGWFGDGFYLTASTSLASTYAMRERDHSLTERPASVMPVYVKLENPFRVNLSELSHTEASSFTEKYGGNDGFKAWLEKNGHDGVIGYRDPELAGEGAEHWEVVVFRPEQIKSAIGNIGTFDPSNADIRLKSSNATETPAFKNWFGDSKVVDADGKPVIVRHGTYAEFYEFRPSETGTLGKGIYFAESDSDSADQYGERAIDAYLSLQNPWVIDIDYESDAVYVEDVENPAVEAVLALEGGREILDRMKANSGEHFDDQLTNALIARGHDGIIATYPDGSREYVAFSPEQIKSATENIGTFDPSNRDIRFSFAGTIALTANQETLRQAQTLAQEGASPALIQKETGWHRGVDGRWRFEISDDKAVLRKVEAIDHEALAKAIEPEVVFLPDGELVKAQYKPGTAEYVGGFGRTREDALTNLARHIARQSQQGFDIEKVQNGDTFTLDQVLDHPDLFAAYPFLAGMAVQFTRGGDKNNRGAFYEEPNLIELNADQAPADILSTLLHETQHVIQARENFARGGNSDYAFSQSIKHLLQRMSEDQARELELWKYRNASLLDESQRASELARNALKFESVLRLMSYGSREKPSGVFRLIRSEMQWIYGEEFRGNEAARELAGRFYELPKRGDKRNLFIRDLAYDAAQVIRSSIPADQIEQFIADERSTKAMVKALRRQATAAHDKLKPMRDQQARATTTEHLYNQSRHKSAYEVYRSLAGEIEARTTQARQHLTADERRDRPVALDMDVSPAEAIVVVGGLELQPPFAADRAMNKTDSQAFKQWFGKSLVVDEDGNPQVMYHGSYRDFTAFDRMASTMTRRTSMDTIGSWFSDNPGEGGAGMYASGEGGVIYPVYLQIERPKVYDSFAEFLADMHEANGGNPADQANGLGSPEALRERLMQQGYDGIAFTRTNNHAIHSEIAELEAAVARAREEYRQAASDMRKAGLEMTRVDGEPYQAKIDRLQENIAQRRTEIENNGSTEFDNQYVWIAFRPEQIKSAIGNVGAFNPESPDIRFSFAGPSAQTADVALLSQARARIAAGEDSERVRRETGWFQGHDHGWRFEIDDSLASIPDAFYLDGEANGKPVYRASGYLGDHTVALHPVAAAQLGKAEGFVKGILDHPQLFEAYPQLRGVKVEIESCDGFAFAENGEFRRGTVDDQPRDSILLRYNPSRGGSALSALMHEVQHAIQKVEGFARGGSTSEFDAEDLAGEELRTINHRITQLMGNHPETAQVYRTYNQLRIRANAEGWPDQLMGTVAALEAELLEMPGGPQLFDLETERFGLQFIEKVAAPFEKYRRLAGEVEARNVQTRLGFDAAKRQQRSPLSTEDVSPDQVEVRLNAGSTLAMALQQEQTEQEAARETGLDLSREARLARAEAMGFDTSQVWYHGSDNAGFKVFNTSGAGKTRHTGAFLANHRLMAGSYAKRDTDAPIFTGLSLFNDPDQLDDLEIERYWVAESPSRRIEFAASQSVYDSANDFIEGEDIELDPGDVVRAAYTIYYQGNQVIEYATEAEAIYELEQIEAKEPGIYELLVRPGDQLVIDWQGRNWNDGPKETIWKLMDDYGDVLAVFNTQQEAQEALERQPDCHIEEDTEIPIWKICNDMQEEIEAYFTLQEAEEALQYHPGCHIVEVTEEVCHYHSTDDAARQARDMGYDSVLIKNVYDSGSYSQGHIEGDVLVVFNPTNLRSTDAAFDPRHSASANLLFSIAQAPQSTVFDQWFDGSQVCNPDGSPMVVYLGDSSSRPADSVFLSGLGSLGFSDFQTAQQHAQQAAGEASGGARITPAYLAIKRPLLVAPNQSSIPLVELVEAIGAIRTNQILSALGIAQESAPNIIDLDRLMANKECVAVLKRAGYDGAVYSRSGEQAAVIYRVFDPAQVASGSPMPATAPAPTPATRMALAQPAPASHFFTGSPLTGEQFTLEQRGVAIPGQYGYGIYYPDAQAVARSSKPMGINRFGDITLTPAKLNQLRNQDSTAPGLRRFLAKFSKQLADGEDVQALLQLHIKSLQDRLEDIGRNLRGGDAVHLAELERHVKTELGTMINSLHTFQHIKGSSSTPLANYYLAWNAPLYSQPEEVRDALSMLGIDGYWEVRSTTGVNHFSNQIEAQAHFDRMVSEGHKPVSMSELDDTHPGIPSGGEIYRELVSLVGSAKEVSTMLELAGIKGVRYQTAALAPDAATERFVVFTHPTQPASVAMPELVVKAGTDAPSYPLPINKLPAAFLNGSLESVSHNLLQTQRAVIAGLERSIEDYEQRRQWLVGLPNADFQLIQLNQAALSKARSELQELRRWKRPTLKNCLPWTTPLDLAACQRLAPLIRVTPEEQITGEAVFHLLAERLGGNKKATQALSAIGLIGARTAQAIALWDESSRCLSRKIEDNHDRTRFHLVAHGSKHFIEKFDSSRIGTGEGVQAYGYGLYFAERKMVASHYQKMRIREGCWYEDTFYENSSEMLQAVMKSLAGKEGMTEEKLSAAKHCLSLASWSPGRIEDVIRNYPENIQLFLHEVVNGFSKISSDQLTDFFVFPANGVRGLNEIIMDDDRDYSLGLQHLTSGLHYYVNEGMDDQELSDALSRHIERQSNVQEAERAREEVDLELEQNPDDSYLAERLADCDYYLRLAYCAKKVVEEFGPFTLQRPLGSGNIYLVDLTNKQSEYLKYDEPFSLQSTVVQDALRQISGGNALPESHLQNLLLAIELDQPGSELLGALAGRSNYYTANSVEAEKIASDLLLSHGVKGIKYQDGVSRDRDSKRQTYNYVIFDADSAQILGHTNKHLRSEADEIPLYEWADLPDDRAGIRFGT